MKKQNKIYLPLKEQGIKKAWDKAIIFRPKKDSGHKYLQMVVYWQNKPFAYWAVENAFDVKGLRISLYNTLKYYGYLELNSRRTSKRITKNFIELYAAEKVASYKRGGDLIPKMYPEV